MALGDPGESLVGGGELPLGELLEVHAGAERLVAGTGQDDRPYLVIGGALVERVT